VKILFVCLGNSVRSIMAEYIAREKFGLDSDSAGLSPSEEVYSMTWESLMEVGIKKDDWKKPVGISEKLVQKWDKIISLDKQATEELKKQGITVIEWDIQDPTGYPIDKFKQTRDEITNKIKQIS
jgi:protein-tyrosine-phosphatase